MVPAILAAAEIWIAGGTLVSPQGAHSRRAIQVRDGRIAALADAPPAGAAVLDARGLFLTAAVIDAHVHLNVAGPLPAVAKAELDGGVAAVLDLGAPEALLASLRGLQPLHVAVAGPLITASKGYPTQSWGKDGYGLELETPEHALAALEHLIVKSHLQMVKLAFDDRFPVLSPEVAKIAVGTAHRHGLKAAAHALSAAMVRRALDAGVDVLAHTPVERLPDAMVREIGRRRLHVLSTLKAFGGTPAALDNLRRLRAAGARVAYGTDLGNQGTAPGIDAGELGLLAAAGLKPSEILQSATEEPAALLGLTGLGALEVGREASILAFPADPALQAEALAHPAWVLIKGVRR